MRKPTTFLSLFYLSFVGVCVAMQRTSILILALYTTMSFIAFLQFARDKKSAIDGGLRFSEKSLLTSCLLGGWPGALIAQHKFRHKTQKQPFKTLMWFSIAINCSAFIWTMSERGNYYIASILANVNS